MGCHTWFYKKLDKQLDYEYIREKMLAHYKNEMGYCECHISDTLAEDEKWLFENESVEESKYALEVLKRRYSLIEGGFCKLATAVKYCDSDTNLGLDFSRVDNQFYCDVDEHDIFRVSDYSNDELFSLQDTLDFVEKHKEGVYWYDENWKDKLKEFWIEYPNGRITFG